MPPSKPLSSSSSQPPAGALVLAAPSQKPGEKALAGAEYLYTNLDDGDYRVRAQGPAAPGNAFLLVNAAGTDFARSQEDIELHSFRLTLAYRF